MSDSNLVAKVKFVAHTHKINSVIFCINRSNWLPDLLKIDFLTGVYYLVL